MLRFPVQTASKNYLYIYGLHRMYIYIYHVLKTQAASTYYKNHPLVLYHSLEQIIELSRSNKL